MIIYLTAFSIGLLLISLTEIKKLTEGLKRMLVIISFMPLLLISIFRINTGTDYYVYSIKQIPQVLQGNGQPVEYLYEKLIQFGHFLDKDSYFWIFALTHIVIFIFCVLSIFYTKVNYRLAYIFFFISTYFNISLNLMRQSISMAIFYFALYFIYKRKWKQYIILIFIGMLFHTSIIVCLPLYFLNKLPFKLMTVKNISIVCLIFFLIAMPIRSLINIVISNIPRYAAYNGNKYDNLITGLGSYFNIFTWISLITLIIILFNLKTIRSNKDLSGKSSVMLSLIILTLITSFYQPIIPNANRIIYIFLFSSFLTLPYFIELIAYKKRFLVQSLLILLFVILFYNSIVLNNTGETLPYYSIFGI